MFRFKQEPSSGSQSQCLTKITGMVPLCLFICALPLLWWHIPTCCMCVCVVGRANHIHIQQVGTLATHISTSTVEPYLHFI